MCQRNAFYHIKLQNKHLYPTRQINYGPWNRLLQGRRQVWLFSMVVVCQQDQGIMVSETLYSFLHPLQHRISLTL